MGDRMPRTLGNYEPDYTALAVSQHVQGAGNEDHRNRSQSILESEPSHGLPSYLGILSLYFRHTQLGHGSPGPGPFINSVISLQDVEFGVKHPLLGAGQDFTVSESPFPPSYQAYTPIDGRSINNQKYCLKTPNFNSAGNLSPTRNFRRQYYDRVLRELQVLLHPHLRTCENIISLFGLDFQEDYDDHAVAWPILFLEYADFGTLATFQEDSYLGPELSRILLLDVARGIRSLHASNVIHGDIKSENVLICRHHQRKYVARLSGFGLVVINPDPAKDTHKLLGGTFLWSAPESGQALTISGLQQTDTFSFGLMAWRVFRCDPNPYRLIPPEHLGIQEPGLLRDIVSQAKAHPSFPGLVQNTMVAQQETPLFFNSIVECTLASQPSSRILQEAITILEQGQGSNFSSHPENTKHWKLEEPVSVLKELHKVYAEGLGLYTLKPSLLLSLSCALSTAFESNSDVASEAGWLLFRISCDPYLQVLKKDDGHCCGILFRLCELGSSLGRAISAQYHDICEIQPQALGIQWLEEATSNGSYYAKQSLHLLYPERYQRLMNRPLNFEHATTDAEVLESPLVQATRAGSYESCLKILRDDTPLPQYHSGITPLHWLVAFQDEIQIEALVRFLVNRGASLDAWEGDIEDDYALGKVGGTPLCWAVWHRNGPLVRILLQTMIELKVQLINRLVALAAAMHFYDILEILRNCQFRMLAGSKPDWQNAIRCVARNKGLQLPRRLRHGDNNAHQALERTLNIIMTTYSPTKEDLKIMFRSAIFENNSDLLRYMFERIELDKHKDILRDPTIDPLLIAVTAGYKDVFEVLIAKGLIGPGTEHCAQKWKPLQVCCFSRQRDPFFARRLIEVGCPVDGRGSTSESSLTPLALAIRAGRYDVASVLLEFGANKDLALNGSSITMNLLESWPEVPISRMKYILEEIPRLGYGHVRFQALPGAEGNLLYALALSHDRFHGDGNHIAETASYILSRLADKVYLDKIDKLGLTVFGVASMFGNYDVCKALLAAGVNVDHSSVFTPLKGAKEWRNKCLKAEKDAFDSPDCPGSLRRQAQMRRARAEMTVDLLVVSGGTDKTLAKVNAKSSEWWHSSKLKVSVYETVFDSLSSAAPISAHAQIKGDSLKHDRKDDSKSHHGRKSWISKKLDHLEKKLDNSSTEIAVAVPRYQQHSCHPWQPCASNSSSLQTSPQILTATSSLGTRTTSVQSLPLPNISRLRASTSTSSLPTDLSRNRHSIALATPQQSRPAPTPAQPLDIIAELEGAPVPPLSTRQIPIRTPSRPTSMPPPAPIAFVQPPHQATPIPPTTFDQLQAPSRTSSTLSPSHVSSQAPSYTVPGSAPASTQSPIRQHAASFSHQIPQIQAAQPASFVQPRPQFHSAPPTFVSNVPDRPMYPPVQTYTPMPRPQYAAPFIPAPMPTPVPVPSGQFARPTSFIAPGPGPALIPAMQSPPPQALPQNLSNVVQAIQNVLLLHFLEGPGASMTNYQLRKHTIVALQGLLRAPIILKEECENIETEGCEEYDELKGAVERCLETIGISGCLMLVPELGEGGMLLGVHVFES